MTSSAPLTPDCNTDMLALFVIGSILLLGARLTHRSPPGSCECLLTRRQVVHAERVELRDGWATRIAPIWSIARIPIDVVASIPVGRVETGKKRLRENFGLRTLGSSEEVGAPLPPCLTSEARVEKVLIEQDQVAGFAHDDVCGQAQVCRTIDSKSAQSIPKFRVVRTRQDPQGAVLPAERLEVGEKADTGERRGRIYVPRSIPREGYPLCPGWQHGATEQARCYCLDTIQQGQAYGRLNGHHRHILETDLIGPRNTRHEPIVHDAVDLRCERARVEELAEHAESECSKAIFRT